MDESLRYLRIFDTTMRDGEAAPGNAMSVETKLHLGRLLEELGVDVIEPGFPAASEVDQEIVRRLSRDLTTSSLNLFCRAKRDDVDIALACLDGDVDVQVQILTVGSDIHLKHKRMMTRDEAIRECVDAIDYARRRGLEKVSVAPEDATRGDPDYLRRLAGAAVEAGATMVGIPDTTGAALPHEFAALVRRFRSWVGPDIGISAHCHDDMGLGVANALAAVEAGADEVQATLTGIGERAGNTALEELVAALVYKQDHYGVTTGIRTDKLYATTMELVQAIDLPLSRNKAVIGDNAFATEAGLHQAGLLNDPITYEFLEPGRFGRSRRLLIGRQSGRKVIRHRFRQLGIEPSGDEIEQMYTAIIRSAEPASFNDDDHFVSVYRELTDAGAPVRS